MFTIFFNFFVNFVQLIISFVFTGFKSGITKAPGADHAYLGCMKDIQINGETYDPLESPSFYGVESSCKDTITK